MAIIKPAPAPGPELSYKFQANLRSLLPLGHLPSQTCIPEAQQSILGPSLSSSAAYPISFLPISSLTYNHPQSNHGHFLQELINNHNISPSLEASVFKPRTVNQEGYLFHWILSDLLAYPVVLVLKGQETSCTPLLTLISTLNQICVLAFFSLLSSFISDISIYSKTASQRVATNFMDTCSFPTPQLFPSLTSISCPKISINLPDLPASSHTANTAYISTTPNPVIHM